MNEREFKFKMNAAKELDSFLADGYDISERNESGESWIIKLKHKTSQRVLNLYYDAEHLKFTITNAAGKVLTWFYG